MGDRLYLAQLSSSLCKRHYQMWNCHREALAMKSMYLAVLTVSSTLAVGLAFAGSQYDPGTSDTEDWKYHALQRTSIRLGRGGQVRSCVLRHDQRSGWCQRPQDQLH